MKQKILFQILICLKNLTLNFLKSDILRHVILLAAIMFGNCVGVKSQNYGMVVQGANIIVSDSNYIYIPGDMEARIGEGPSQGVIDLDGTIILEGDIINSSWDYVFVNREPIPDGLLLMNGTYTQHVIGTITPIKMENITIENSDKVLELTNCETNGVLKVDAVLKLNSNRFIIDNPSQTGITWVSDYILSETPPADGYGEIQWNIGDNIAKYDIPFGTEAGGKDHNLTYKPETSTDARGNVVFATYPTDNDLTPYPTDAPNPGVMDPDDIVNRYWIIDASSYITKPDVDYIIFRFTQKDLEKLNGENLYPEYLKGSRYNTDNDALNWDDWEAKGDFMPSYAVKVTDIEAGEFYAPWRLLKESPDPHIWVPTAFTPNGDGLNDIFRPVLYFEPDYYKITIWNRWGNKIFESNDKNIGWDGRSQFGDSGEICPQAVYVWQIEARSQILGINYKNIGSVTLLK